MKSKRDGTWFPSLVEGKPTYSFTLAHGRHVHGHDFLQGQWPWRDHPWEPWVRYVRLPAKSPTYGDITGVMVDAPGQDRFYRLCCYACYPIMRHEVPFDVGKAFG